MKRSIINRLMALGLSLSILFVSVSCAPKADDATPTPTPASEVDIGTPETPKIEVVADPSETPKPTVVLDGIPDVGDEVPKEKMSYDKDYARIKGQNSDTFGWLSVPNTRIEYPIMLAKDNDFYLTHNTEKNYSKSGSVFMDYRNANKSKQRHIILYGHNMRNGTMFHDLINYKVKDFFDNNGIITMYWDNQKVQYEVFASYIVTADIDFIRTNFKDDTEFLEYMNQLRTLSKFKPKKDFELKADDQVITLVTCTYEYDNSRFAIQARRVK